jgi:ATP-dependent RNA helicase RhlE
VIREIERVLGAKIERRILECFDYEKPVPIRDAEFARLPGREKALCAYFARPDRG